MNSVRLLTTKPKIAVLYILDEKKCGIVPGLGKFVEKTKNALRGQGWDLCELGTFIDADKIADIAFSAQGQYDALLGITFHGTSAQQTANLVHFNGSIGTWYFPMTDWWSTASSGSGQGLIRDEAKVNSNVKHTAIFAQPDSQRSRDQLDAFAAVAHTRRAMKQEKIGLIGNSYIKAMPASNWHPDILTSKLGPRFADISITRLLQECDNCKECEVDDLLVELKQAGISMASDDSSTEANRKAARVSVALEKIQVEEGLTGIAMNCYGGSDPQGYTGLLGLCGANGCLKGHACDSVIVGCESDVIQTAQQMMFRHLVETVPCMADPWKIDVDTGIMTAATCSGPLSLARIGKRRIERGTLMSLYKVGVLGVCFPEIEPADVIVARIVGRDLGEMIVSTGKFLGGSTEIIPGRLSLQVKLDSPDEFLARGVSGNHYTFLPTNHIIQDMNKLEKLCENMGIRILRC